MAQIIKDRMMAQIEGDFVVFLIGMRVNRWWKVHKWLPTGLAMNSMLKELHALPSEETGFLGHFGGGARVTVQYWRSFEHLEAYASAKDRAHFPAWAAFNKCVKNSRGDVGIWHETFLVKDGHFETLYAGMPAMGLGAAATLTPVAKGRQSSRERLRVSQD